MSRALVTGGGSGIGLAIARRLAAEGHEVVVAGRDRKKLAQSGLETALLDVTDRGSVRRAVAETGPFSVVVSNAGIAPTAPADRTPTEMWDEVLATNVTGAFHLAAATLPAMRQAGHGRFVAIASTAALSAYRYTAAYTASKHALLGLVRTLALEFARDGVTCNAVCPGFTDTAIVRGAVSQITAKTGRSENEAMAAFTAGNPAGRLVQPAEVAAVVAWLCSDAASATNGAAIPVDGGETAG